MAGGCGGDAACDIGENASAGRAEDEGSLKEVMLPDSLTVIVTVGSSEQIRADQQPPRSIAIKHEPIPVHGIPCKVVGAPLFLDQCGRLYAGCRRV